MITPKLLIEKYKLEPHPEGGWYKENYRSPEMIDYKGLPKRYSGNRSFSTSIYFLLERGEFSAFHKIQSDECWHFYAGDPMEIYVIEKDGSLTVTLLGNNIEADEVFHYVVTGGLWFASKPAPQSAFSFVGCTVAPGFEFSDFELADAQELSKEYPQHSTVINELCI